MLAVNVTRTNRVIDYSGPKFIELLDYRVDVRNRVIYLFNEITIESVAEFKCNIQKIYSLSHDSTTPITIDINCFGGSSDSMFGIIDALPLMSSPINTFCNGSAMSAAATILACGTGTRKMTKNSLVMIHRVSNSEFDELTAKDKVFERQMLKRLNSMLFNVLAKNTKKNADFWSTNTKTDFVLTAAEALKYGVVDVIV